MNRVRAALPLLLLLATGATLLWSGGLDLIHPRQVAAEHAQMQQAIAAAPLVSRLAFVGLMTLTVATGVPGTLLVVLTGGLLFGVAEGTALSVSGLVLGSLLLFLAARFAFGRGTRPPPALVERLRVGFARHPASYTFFLRFVPVLPYGGVTLALAWLRCPLRLFLAATAIGGSVMLAFETALGAGLGAATDELARHGVMALLRPGLLWPLAALALLSLVPLLWHRRRRD
jgi:uncharacterized membrane protein YdjX (TVP38/TMEM64 family)